MGVISAAVRPCARSAAHSVMSRRGNGFSSDLSLLWSSAKPLRSIKGETPVYSDTPTVDADGVTPGDGPSFSDVVTWSDGGTLVVRFTATTASADLVGDVQVFGSVYAASTGLKAKDGVNTAVCATSWASGAVVTAVLVINALGKMFMGVA